MYSGIKRDDLVEVFMPIGFLKEDALNRLAEKKSVSEMLESSGLVKIDSEKSTLLEWENFLDKEYFRRILEFSGTLSGEGMIFSKFLRNEIDIINLMTVLRCKLLNIHEEDARELVIFSGNLLKSEMLEKLIRAKSVQEVMGAIRKTPYHQILSDFVNNSRQWAFLKSALYRELLHKSLDLMHSNMLSVDTILAFALSKEMEVRNLKIIIKGKQLGIEPGLIEEELVWR